MPTGTVKFFNESKGFGFIQPEDGGADAFVHISDVERSGMSTLRKSARASSRRDHAAKWRDHLSPPTASKLIGCVNKEPGRIRRALCYSEAICCNNPA